MLIDWEFYTEFTLNSFVLCVIAPVAHLFENFNGRKIARNGVIVGSKMEIGTSYICNWFCTHTTTILRVTPSLSLSLPMIVMCKIITKIKVRKTSDNIYCVVLSLLFLLSSLTNRQRVKWNQCF